MARCAWCGDDPLYTAYHDHEWGRPTSDDRYLFEKLCLEGFQSGLSWLTILRKRENFRRAFANFDAEALCRFGPADVTRLLADAGIVRHRGKIESVLNNARRAVELRAEAGSLHAFVQRFAPDPRPERLDWATLRSDPQDTGIHGAEQGAAQARLELRRADHRLCVHAGGGAGGRSRGGLLGRAGASSLTQLGCRTDGTGGADRPTTPAADATTSTEPRAQSRQA